MFNTHGVRFPTEQRIKELADFLTSNDYILLIGDSDMEFEMSVPELMKLIHDHKEYIRLLEKKK